MDEVGCLTLTPKYENAMSRSGYCDDLEPLDQGRWRGMVASATRGKRGQKLFSDLLKALDDMPEKRLIKDELETADGEVCALGVLGKARNIEMKELDPEDTLVVAEKFDVAECLAQEVVFMNDEYFWDDTPEERWTKVRAWVAKQINPILEQTH
jgi:hypothetical protein